MPCLRGDRDVLNMAGGGAHWWSYLLVFGDDVGLLEEGDVYEGDYQVFTIDTHGVHERGGTVTVYTRDDGIQYAVERDADFSDFIEDEVHFLYDGPTYAQHLLDGGDGEEEEDGDFISDPATNGSPPEEEGGEAGSDSESSLSDSDSDSDNDSEAEPAGYVSNPKKPPPEGIRSQIIRKREKRRRDEDDDLPTSYGDEPKHEKIERMKTRVGFLLTVDVYVNETPDIRVIPENNPDDCDDFDSKDGKYSLKRLKRYAKMFVVRPSEDHAEKQAEAVAYFDDLVMNRKPE